MDESVISAMAEAAMLNGAETLTEDLEKIEKMTARAAVSAPAENAEEKTAADDFFTVMGVSGNDKKSLREDSAVKSECGDVISREIVSQSKRNRGEYNSVPRIV